MMKSLQLIKSWKFHQLFVFDCVLMFIQLATIQVAWPIKSSIGLPDIIRVASEHGGETSFSPKLRHSCDKRCTHAQRKKCWTELDTIFLNGQSSNQTQTHENWNKEFAELRMEFQAGEDSLGIF